MNWIVRWYVWWPLTIMALGGLVALFFLPQPAKQIALSLVFMVLILLIAWTSKRNMQASWDAARYAERRLARSMRVSETYAEHFDVAMHEIAASDPDRATELQRDLAMDLVLPSRSSSPND